MAKAKSRPRKIGCVQHDCAACKRTAARMKKLERVLELADEFTNAIDLAEADIGGGRKPGDVLKDLGPAVEAALGRR